MMGFLPSKYGRPRVPLMSGSEWYVFVMGIFIGLALAMLMALVVVSVVLGTIAAEMQGIAVLLFEMSFWCSMIGNLLCYPFMIMRW
jgi:tetrahydromethanopterin S-methyltransferase subunit B